MERPERLQRRSRGLPAAYRALEGLQRLAGAELSSLAGYGVT